MPHKICTYCGKPVVLSPSAESRARDHGKTAKYYIDLFPMHTMCAVEKRNADTSELMKRRDS